jgi:hypothetical protein
MQNKNVFFEQLFDEYFGFMRGGYLLNESEYDEIKKYSIESGLFEYQITFGSLKQRNAIRDEKSKNSLLQKTQEVL